MNTTETVLEIRGLQAGYGATPILQGVDLAVGKGEIVALIGRNGVGKTTTMRCLMGLLGKTGEIRLAGQRIDGHSTEKTAALGIAHVPDGRGTLVNMTVEENLRVGAYLRRGKAEVEQDMERMFGYFPRLRERRGQQAGTLSGGEQQMLAISRALMQRPRLLLMDEPSFGLAPLVIREIFEIMRVVNREEGVGILLVEQNVARALEIADHAWLLETGRTVISGTAKQLRDDAQIRRSYLGF